MEIGIQLSGNEERAIKFVANKQVMGRSDGVAKIGLRERFRASSLLVYLQD